MANYCDFTMKVTGSEKSIKELIKTINTHYDYKKKEFSGERHLCRIYETYIGEDLEELECLDYEHDIYEIYISGYCAWSVSNCMFDGPLTDYRYICKHYRNKSKVTTLINECRRLNLFIEITSEEPGDNLAEYYFISPRGLVERKRQDLETTYDDDGEEVSVYNSFREYIFKTFTYEDFLKNPPRKTNYRDRRRRHKRKLKKRIH